MSESFWIILCVFLGGGIGSVCRWSFTTAVLKRTQTKLPLATLIINVSGSFAIGVLASAFSGSSLLTSFFIVGLLGGYTTFSTYELESACMFKTNARLAFAYWLGSIALGIIFAFGGIVVGGWIL